MTVETIDIIVRENGARVVKRRLEEIGEVAERSVRGLRLLQNSLFVLGGAGLLAGLTRMLDQITNFSNRLKLVTSSAQEAAAVQQELFNVANRTRTSFESTAEVYTRAALAVRQLGLSQRETLQFTESLNQATILSGAGVREANNALIQLSQGLASGRLNGDELRSVLEQLPYVADVIAKFLTDTGKFGKVTRGELRKLGADGKITADIIIDAFKSAREELQEKFGQTVPTIGQALSVAFTEFQRILANFTGVSGTVAYAIISIADSLEVLVAGVVSATAAFAAFKLTNFVTAAVAAVQANRQLAAAVASGNAVLLTSVEIERAKAASALASAQATAVDAAAKVRDLQLGIAQLQQQRALLVQQQASITLDAQRRVARDSLTGRFVAYNAAVAQTIRTNVALRLTEDTLTASSAQLSAAMGTQASAATAVAAAQARSGVAAAAANTWTAKLARAFPTLAGAINVVSAAFVRLGAAMLANPIAFIIAAIVAVVAALVYFSDQISISSDGIVTLRDLAVASFQLIMQAIGPVVTAISSGFQTAVEYASKAWSWFSEQFGAVVSNMLSFFKNFVNFVIGYWVGMTNSIVKSFSILPAALLDIGAIAINGLIDVIGAGVKFIAEALKKLLGFLGSAAESVGADNPFSSILDNFEIDLDKFRPKVSGAAREVGQIFTEEFSKSMSTDYVGGAADAVGSGVDALMLRARDVANKRLADLDAKKKREAGSGDGSGAGGGKSFADIVRDLTVQNEMLRVNSSEREKMQALLQVEEQLKRKLTETERGLVLELLNENEVLKRSAELYAQIKEPADEYNLTLQALNELLKSGKISQEEFTRSVRDSRIEFLNSQTDMASGLERGVLKILQKTGDFASQMEGIVTNAFDGMSSAIADLVVDGEADFGSLIKSINKQIVQLVVSQAFQQLFGGFKGGTGTGPTGGGNNIFSGLFSGIKGLLGFQNGGQFTVGSNTGIAPLPGVDNRLVAFRAQDGEQVTVTPKGQRASGGEQSINVVFNVSTPDARSFRQSESQFAAKAARVIAQGRRNM